MTKITTDGLHRKRSTRSDQPQGEVMTSLQAAILSIEVLGLIFTLALCSIALVEQLKRIAAALEKDERRK